MDVTTDHTNIAAAQRLIRLADVMRATGHSRSQIYDLIKRGEFPAQIVLSRRMVAWDARAIDQWIDEKLAAAPKATRPH